MITGRKSIPSRCGGGAPRPPRPGGGLTERTLLSRLLGQDTVLVNSQHHQAADRIAPELEIAALSEDGIVEALEKPDAHFCLGVQWHPEWLSDADPAQQGLFGAFVEACRG